MAMPVMHGLEAAPLLIKILPHVWLIVVRKNSIRARKTMEMLSFTSLVFSLPDCRNPGAIATRSPYFWSEALF
jgi:hypothetical protein